MQADFASARESAMGCAALKRAHPGRRILGQARSAKPHWKKMEHKDNGPKRASNSRVKNSGAAAAAPSKAAGGQKSGAIQELFAMGITADRESANWTRSIQGVCSVEGIGDGVQVRVLQKGAEHPPRIQSGAAGQAEAVLAWFEGNDSREAVLERIGAKASELMGKASIESKSDTAKLAKTIQKHLQAGAEESALDELLDQAHAQWGVNWRIRSQAGDLERELSLNAYPQLFPMARAMRRQIEIFTGPTNSGKTYAGMQLLAGAQSGAYLAPLRLLAMEGQEALQERGFACSLVTGEERRINPDARFVASTVEMADFSTPIDAAVIDEAQMLADKDRGWAWTAAIFGLPAQRLAIVCAPEAVEMVQKLLARAGEECVVHRFERKTPLEPIAKPVPLSDIREGDALIAFSRRNALMWRDKMVAQGKTVAVIYGALAPEVRRSEAKRFSEGAAQVLVATDAIGMGLNLPIKRVILTTASKFDGTEIRELCTQEVRQIAGRAGRYGVAERGFAGALEASDCKVVAKALAGGVEVLDERASIAPNDRQIEQMSAVMGTDRLVPILSFFKDHLVKSDKLFKASDMEDMMDLAWRADRRLALDLNTRFAFAKTPLDRNDDDHVKAWESWMLAFEQGKTVKAPVAPMAPKSSREDDRLWECERAMKLLSSYCWLSWRFEDVFTDRLAAESARMSLSAAIERMLSKMGTAKEKAEPRAGSEDKRDAGRGQRAPGKAGGKQGSKPFGGPRRGR